MITDQEVIQLYGNLSAIPLGLTDSAAKGKNRQLFSKRGEKKFPEGCPRHMEVFNRYEVIPEYCFACYKVLIAPRNVMELFKLLMIFDFRQYELSIENRRKCMVEERDDCGGAYKGFVFCQGLKEGNEVFQIVRKAVSDHISPLVDVTLKRGCSEYAKIFPRFPRTKSGKKPNQAVMPYKKSWKTQEEIFDKNFTVSERELPPDPNDDTPYLSGDGVTTYTGKQIFCMQYWLRYAATIGDMSYQSIVGTTLPPLTNLKRPPFKGISDTNSNGK